MKITKRQLKRIIKEEKSRLLRELEDPSWKKGHAGGAPARPGPITTDVKTSDLQSSINQAVLDMIYDDAMYTELDLEDPDVVEAIAAGFDEAISHLRRNAWSRGV